MASGQKQRVFSGTVTKIHDNFGFIDDDVFFQLAVCDGKIPAIGDKVFAEAHFNAGMPFKWTATRVQFAGRQMQNSGRYGGMQSASQNRHSLPQGLKFVSGHGGAGLLGPAPVMMHQRPNQQRHQMKGHRGNGPRPTPRDRRHSPPKNRDRKRRASPHKLQSPSRSQRSVSTDKSDKSQRRPAPRYMVSFVKRPLTIKYSDVLDLKGLYSNLYVPSDFFAANRNWQETFPVQQPFSARKCLFHILNKDVETLEKIEDEVQSPPDADHTWVAKVMLLNAPAKDETYKQCCRLADEPSEHFLHQSRVYQFLVGKKGKHELMAIGGSWSPSLDGADPGTNPCTLVNTAIRTCKALAGIDLSKCTSWRRMLEIQYCRAEEVRKGHTVPARVETTVVFLPDVHSCLPSPHEYDDLRAKYLDKCEAVVAAAARQEEESSSSDVPAAEPMTKVEEISEPTATSTEAAVEDSTTDHKEKEEEIPVTPVKQADESMDDSVNSKTPTHHSKLDVKTLKVQLLRKELDARGLSSRGLKAALVTRLTEAVEAEQKGDAEKVEDAKMDVDVEKGDAADAKPVDLEKEEFITKDEAVGDDEDVQEEKTEAKENGKDESKVEDKISEEQQAKNEKEKEEKEEARRVHAEKLKQHYTLPESHPIIPVHPNAEFKKGNFECVVTPLSSLLGYRQEDNKESIFEVSLFAEAFTEMLQRDHAFNIYTALCNPLPEIKVEEEKEPEEKKDESEAKEEGDGGEPKAKKSKGENEDPKEEKDETTPDAKGDSEKKKADADADAEKSKVASTKDDKKQDGDANSKPNSSQEKPDEKMVTFRKDLLLSFVYFDQTQCGYIKAGDMANIIHSIGLGLSRSQITKILSKFLDNDVLRYRKLTDTPVSQLDARKELLEKSPKPSFKDLALGNKPLMQHVDNGDNKSAEISESGGFVSFNGTVIDIKALQDKLISSEENQSDMEATIGRLKTDLDTTSKELCKTQGEKKALDNEFEATKKTLSETQDKLKCSSETKSKFEKALKTVAATVETALPKKETVLPKKE